MNERSLEIFKTLIKNPDFKLIDLEKTLKLTKRQINYSFSQLNESLAEQKLPTIGRTKSGNFEVPIDLIQSFAEYFDNQSNNDSIISANYSENERMYLIIVYLLVKKEDISLSHLIEILQVSKNTVLDDLKNVKKELNEYKLSLVYSRKIGYYVSGEELKIRLLLNEIIQKKQIFLDNKNPLTNGINVNRDIVIHFIRNIEKDLGVTYADESFSKLTELIYYSVARMQNNDDKRQDFFKNQVHETIEYQLVRKNVPEDWCNASDDFEWLTLLLLSSNIYQHSHEQTLSQSQILPKITKQMINQFQRQTLIEIENRDVFEKRLLAHLKPAWFRIKYDLKLKDYGTKDLIKDNHHIILIQLMRELVIPIEKEMGKSFPQDELELLSYYFGHQLSKKYVNEVTQKKAVVVCTNGMVVSKMMRETLIKLFPEFNFLATFSVREFQDFQLDYDLVFTTVPLKTVLPQYVVNPIMDYKEQINLRYRVLKETGLTEVDVLIEKLMQIIDKNTDIKNEKNLRVNLKEFFLETNHQSQNSEFNVLPDLVNYIKPQSIQIIEDSIGWKQALKIAAEPLIAQKIISDKYLNELIRQTADEKNASFLGEKMAIPHSDMKSEVLGEGIALLICKKPIIFPNNQKINFIAPIAIMDYSNHLRAINQLADLALNKTQNMQLLAMENVMEVHQLIAQLD